MMLESFPGIYYLYASVQTSKDYKVTTRFYAMDAGSIIFVHSVTPHQFDLGSEIIFAIQRQDYFRNKDIVEALFSGTKLYLVEESDV